MGYVVEGESLGSLVFLLRLKLKARSVASVLEVKSSVSSHRYLTADRSLSTVHMGHRCGGE